MVYSATGRELRNIGASIEKAIHLVASNLASVAYVAFTGGFFR